MEYEYKPGLGAVGEYQASGKPFISGSCAAFPIMPVPPHMTMKVEFPSVTSWVTLTNLSTTMPLVYGFSEEAVSNWIGGPLPLPQPAPVPGEFVGILDINDIPNVYNGNAPGKRTITLEVKVCEMFFLGSDFFDVVAGLTAISCTENLPNNWSGSIGVG